jgi:phosphatidylglycerol:prolipoprotein diacylglycerol transferase
MWPIIFKTGPFSLHTYGALVAAGFLAAYGWMVRLAKTKNISSDTILDFTWILLISGLIGARLLFVAFNWDYYSQAPVEILFLWQGGLVFYGGLILATIAGALWVRRRGLSAALMADIAAPSLALGHAFGRLGCFAAGCCYGKPCDLPWAVTFSHAESLGPRGVPLHPSQLYEAGLNFLLFFILNAYARKTDSLGTGRVAALYVFSYSLIRLAVEFTRGDERGPVFLTLTATQWIVVAIFAAAAGWIIRSMKRTSHV